MWLTRQWGNPFSRMKWWAVSYLSYLILPLAVWCFHLSRELRDCRRELKSCRASEWTSGEGQKETLEALSPHFLFNALNTIRYLVRTNQSHARELLYDLSLILQSVLRSESQVSLRDELETGRAYLRLERARIGERLGVDDRVPDQNLDQLIQSRLLLSILQSLVKGVADRRAGGTVSLSLQGDLLVLESDAATDFRGRFPQGVTASLNPNPRIEWRLK